MKPMMALWAMLAGGVIVSAAEPDEVATQMKKLESKRPYDRTRAIHILSDIVDAKHPSSKAVLAALERVREKDPELSVRDAAYSAILQITGERDPRSDANGAIFGIDGPRGVSNICYIIERSNRTDPALPRINSELGKAVDGMNSTKRFNCVWGRADPYSLSARSLVPAMADNRMHFAKHLSGLPKSGKAAEPFHNAFAAVFEMTGRVGEVPTKTQVVYVVAATDLTAEGLAEVTKANTAKAKIYVIGLTAGGAKHPNWEKLAAANGGSYKAVELKPE